MRSFEELRPLPAGQVLEFWRNSRKEARDPVERALLCNAAILAACCLKEGEPVYMSAGDVLGDLTGGEMERLLARRAEGGGEVGQRMESAGGNPAFDASRFEELEKG